MKHISRVNVVSLIVMAVVSGLSGCEALGIPSGISGDMDIEAIMTRLSDPEVAGGLRSAGGGQSSRRDAIPELFPEVQQLIMGGNAAAEAMLLQFDGLPSSEQDLTLSLYAYALEQMNHVQAIPQLVEFLNANITGDVPATTSAVTHTLRSMAEGIPDSGLDAGAPKGSAYYLTSEMEKTISALEKVSVGTLRSAKPNGAAQDSCGREFYLLENGQRIKDKNGDEIKVGGLVMNPASDEGFAESKPGLNLRARVEEEGGDYGTVFTDPQSGVTFESRPTRRFNCAGFAFRVFNGGHRWRADPGDMLNALTNANVLIRKNESDAEEGDLVFFFQNAGSKPGHVAVVHDISFFGTVTVINADGPTGLFTTTLGSQWLSRYTSRKFYRWENDQPPQFEPVLERSVTNSCFGNDTDGDGWPDTSDCDGSDRCIDPEFAGGGSGTSGYCVFRLPQIGSGQLEVLPANTQSGSIPLCRFEGGGLDCSVGAQLESVTGAFSTAEAAVRSLCPNISNVRILPLGVGPAADYNGVTTFLGSAVYQTLLGCD